MLTLFRRKPFYPLAFLVGSSLATAEQLEAVTNDQAAQAWQQNNLGGQTPQLVQQEDGGTRIEWKGGVTADVYTNNVTTANGSINTPFRSGTFYKGMVQSDLRGINAQAGTVNYFQFGATHTNDRAVLSLYPRQINNIQFGRSGTGYLVAAGDIAPNFSSLSSALGARGAIGQKQIGDNTVYAYGGVVAESWEALENTVTRNQFLRDVVGVKLENAYSQNLKLYATGQAGADRAGSITNPLLPPSILTAKLRAYSTGFQYAQGAYQLAGETAASGYQQNTQAGRNGRAHILDGGWRGEALALRAGYHAIDPEFASLSTMVSAGIKEAYVSGDWTAASWLTLGADLRNSKNTTLAVIGFPSQTTDTDSAAARANINFGPDLPGWGLSLNQNASESRDALANTSRNGQRAAMLNYASPNWTAGLGYGFGETRNSASPTMDSDTTSWQLTLGRSLSDADNTLPSSWSLNINFNAALQDQQLLSGISTRNLNYSLTFTGQRAGWGNLNLLLSSGLVTRPFGQADLKLRSAQLEAVHPFSPMSGIKLYLRDTRSNIGDPLLGYDESVAGVQYTHNF